MKNRGLLNIVVTILLSCSLIGNGILMSMIKTKKTDISYEQFVSFFEKFNSDFGLEEYINLGNNDIPQIIYIDKSASFGKRNYLTVDNAQSALQTQKRIEFLKDDESELVVLDFIYLDSPLYEDLLYWNDPLWNEENSEMKNTFTDNIISYKNILIKISVFSIREGSEESINKSLSSITPHIVNFISNDRP